MLKAVVNLKAVATPVVNPLVVVTKRVVVDNKVDTKSPDNKVDKGADKAVVTLVVTTTGNKAPPPTLPPSGR